MNMLTPTIDTDLLRSFSVVAETRHFTRAAERLNCGQSAVSMQIQRLEEMLQVRLFQRTKRDVHLTPEGEVLLRYAHRVMRLTDEALVEMGRQPTSGRVRIGATDVSMCYLPQILQQFHLRHPMIDIELRCERSWDALDLLEAGAVDIAYVSQRCGRNSGKKITSSPLVWACATHSDVADRDPIPLAVFGSGCIYRKATIDALERSGKAYRLAYESPARAGLNCAVDAGLAVTTIPKDCLTDNLRIIDQGSSDFPALPSLRTYLFGASSKQSRPVRAFSDLLIEKFSANR